jgi:hypothetical protein
LAVAVIFLSSIFLSNKADQTSVGSALSKALRRTHDKKIDDRKMDGIERGGTFSGPASYAVFAFCISRKIGAVSGRASHVRGRIRCDRLANHRHFSVINLSVKQSGSTSVGSALSKALRKK